MSQLQADIFQGIADRLRTNIIDAIRMNLQQNNCREIEFNTPLVYFVTDEDGENEVISYLRLGDGEVTTSFRGDESDFVTTTHYGDEVGHYKLTDLTTDQLIWILRQIETKDYEIFELNGAE